MVTNSDPLGRALSERDDVSVYRGLYPQSFAAVRDEIVFAGSFPSWIGVERGDPACSLRATYAIESLLS